ncbi:Ig-like domain-containing protein [Bifidobacterium simiarum]|uniref:Ig-like domain-containing protein n=1 Tax=Bifidobacterium simiarum TaxID=2045441 RepID=UPI001BDD1C24|nr:Ig-like domain-containing protein [Bifidobacterium simiarum]MBT1165573.1 Ig-like domain-containing protein [Bifidobacterium simiarum]
MLLPMGAVAIAAEGDGGQSASTSTAAPEATAAPAQQSTATPQKTTAPSAATSSTPAPKATQKTAAPKTEALKTETKNTPAPKAQTKTPAPSASADGAQQSGGASANAGCDNSDNACSIKVGATASGRIIDDDDEDWYKFAIPSAGVINLTFSNQQTSSGQWYVTLYDSNLNQLDSYTFDGKSPNHPATTKLGVPGGTYWVKVDCSRWDNPAFGIQYNLKANYTKTSSWETEWNNKPETADPIKVGSVVSGTIINDDDDDYYKFAIPSAGVINLTFSNQQTSNGQWLVTIYDSNLNQLDSYKFDGKSPNHPATTKLGVPGGTYWVKVDCSRWDNPAFGLQYNLKANYTKTAAWETEWNNDFSTADPLPAGGTISGVTIDDGDDDWYKVTVNHADTAQIQFSNEQAAEGKWFVILTDSNLNQMFTEEFYANTTTHAGRKVTLTPGVYYITVDSRYYDQPAYRLQYNVKLALSHPDRYTVAFNSNGGSRVASQTVTSGGRVSQPKNPTRSGYTFAGWYTAANGGARYDFTTPVTANRTLYAHWERIATIRSIADTSVTTRHGVRPTLPSTVTATYTNGTRKAVKVSWPYIYSGQFAKAGTFTVYGTVSGTNVKAKATVRVTASVTSIPAITVSTNAGTRPKLPATVNARFSDGVTRAVRVTWPYIYSGQFAKGGSFVVQGTVSGTSVKAKATVRVVVSIKSIPAITVTTKAGVRPSMPATVKAVYTDNVTRNVKVTWPYIYSGQFAKGGSFVVQGTVSGTSVKAKATVKVTPVVKSIPAITVNTTAKTAPKLPATVKAVYSDGVTRNVKVTWPYIYSGQYAKAGSFSVTGTVAGTSVKARATVRVAAKPVVKQVPVYRVYNRNSGLHHYTTNASERNMLVRLGWRNEGTSFITVAKGTAGAKPVYREYNRHNGNHNWTMNKKEHDMLVRLGWKDEGVAWYAPSSGKNVYRLYNRNSGEHVYTMSYGEYVGVQRAGWKGEGVAWKSL